MSTSYDALNSIVEFDKSQAPPITTASFWMRIKGHEELSLQLQTGGLPMPKSTPIEYSTNVGQKLGSKGSIQLWQTMPFSALEREDISTKDMIIRLLTDKENDRNELEVEFWAGDMQNIPAKKWATMKHCFVSNEEGGEWDVEGAETSLKLSGASLNGYLVIECTERDPNKFASAVALLDKMEATNIGSMEHC